MTYSRFGISSPSPSSRTDWRQEDKNSSYVRKEEKEEKKDKRALKLLLEICKEGISQDIEKEKQSFSKKPVKSLDHEELLAAIPLYFSTLSPDMQSFNKPATPAVTPMQEQLSLFFDTLCAELLVADMESDCKTTVILSGEKLVGTPFHGLEFTIEEYSTAPKVFNVTIRSQQEATLSLVQKHVADFLQYIEDRKFSFSIRRLDTDYLDEPSSFGQEQQSSTDSDEQKESP
jgi:hypothetical protein